MASFQAKIGWERPRKRENKKNSSGEFLPDRNRKFLKNRKQIQKLKNINIYIYIYYGFFQAKIGWERPRKRKKKIIPMGSHPTHYRKL